MIFTVLTLLFTIFPTPFAIFLLGFLSVLVLTCVFKLVKLVLDAIPFLQSWGCFPLTSDAILVLKCVFQVIWSLFVSFEIPGTHTTPAEWALFSLLFITIVRFVRRLLLDEDRDPLER